MSDSDLPGRGAFTPAIGEEAKGERGGLVAPGFYLKGSRPTKEVAGKEEPIGGSDNPRRLRSIGDLVLLKGEGVRSFNTGMRVAQINERRGGGENLSTHATRFLKSARRKQRPACHTA